MTDKCTNRNPAPPCKSGYTIKKRPNGSPCCYKDKTKKVVSQTCTNRNPKPPCKTGYTIKKRPNGSSCCYKDKTIKSTKQSKCSKRNPGPPCSNGFFERKRPNGEICCYKEKSNKKKPIRKIVLMFLTMADHSQPELWSKFLKGHEDKFEIFCHPYLPSSSNDKTPDGKNILDKNISSFLHGKVIQKRANTKWGHLVNAYYALLEEAYKKEPDALRFVYLSDTCVPIMTANEVYEGLSKNLEDTFFDSPLKKRKEDSKRYSKNSYLDNEPLQPRLESVGLFKEHFMKHSGWFALNNKHASILVKNKEAFSIINHVRAGDEHILSILNREEDQMKHIVHKPITYVDWDEAGQARWKEKYDSLWKKYDRTKNQKIKQKIHATIKKHQYSGRIFWHPKAWTKKLTNQDIIKFRNTGCLFARKIEATCDITELLRFIE